MGNKQSSSKKYSSEDGLHPNEKRRLTHFLEEKKGSNNFNLTEIKTLWSDILTPRLLESYAGFLLKTTAGRSDNIDVNEFVSIYVKIVRGTSDEKARAIASIVGSQKNNEGHTIISYLRFCGYLTDLLESYFFGLKNRNDNCYRSWTKMVQPRREKIEEVARGACNDLQRTDDKVRLNLFEDWLHQHGLVNTLHCYVLGSMYNLEPEGESRLIPLAQFPPKISEKSPLLLDLSQVVYINSFLPAEYKEVWRFLFSTHTHGESFSKFAGCIVNEGPIVVVIQTNSNCLFGGFISTNITLGPKWVGSESSFLFKLDSSLDVFPATGYNDHYAYLNCNQSTLPNGLGMGGQYGYWGLFIDSHFGEGECSESCTTFKNYKMLDSQKKFHIKNLEVWGVGEPPPTDEERGERTTTKSGRSALDQDAAGTHLLEMAGREMHSKAIREGMKKKTQED